MSDTDLRYALMMEGRLNLMHLPPGAIAWLWDQPEKQVDAAEALAVAANAHGNPVVDASLLRADQNILLIKCQGGECFRIYPDGGYSHEGTPMDMGGCASILSGAAPEECGCPGAHAEVPDESPGDGYNDAMDRAEPVPERMGNDEHMNTVEPHGEVVRSTGLTNIAGEPNQHDSLIPEDSVGGPTGLGGTPGAGTGNPVVMMIPDEDLDALVQGSFTSGEFDHDVRRGYSDDELEELAMVMDTYET